jgi:PAS domain-containing protein
MNHFYYLTSTWMGAFVLGKLILLVFLLYRYKQRTKRFRFLANQVDVYASFFKQSDIPVLLIEKNTGKIIRVTSGFEKLFDISGEALKDTNWQSLAENADTPDAENAEHALLRSILISHTGYQHELMASPIPLYQFVVFKKRIDESHIKVAESRQISK